MANEKNGNNQDTGNASDTVEDINEVYFINDSDDDVTLETKIGAPGQTSKTDVTLTDNAGKDTVLFKDYPGSIPLTTINKNKALDGYVVTITCLITVTSDNSNYCEELVLIRGGIKDEKYKLYKTLQQKGDSTIPPFSCIITFMKS